MSQNKIQKISGPFKNKALESINLAKNQIKDVYEDTFVDLTNLKSLDLRENLIKSFRSFPKSARLETVQISFNQITDLGSFSNATSIVTFDLKNNKLTELPDEIFVLKNMKILDLSNNDLQSLPPELGLMKNLGKLQIEGNPLRTIRMSIRQGGSEAIKKYLASRITEEDIANKKNNDAKSNLIQEEFHGKATNVSKMVQLIRQMKNTNGDLDLRNKGLSSQDFTEDILVAEKVRSLDISDNKLTKFPPFIDRLLPTSLKINSNSIAIVDVQDIINFASLRDFEMKGNRMTSFCDSIKSKQDIILLQMNYAQLTYLDISQNAIKVMPAVLPYFTNLRSLIVSFNNITSLESLFQEGNLESLDHLDIGNNNLKDIPINIYRWQSLTTLNLQNNDIKNVPPEIGYLPLKSFNITGNPTMLLKGNMATKGAAVLIDYLRDKVVDKAKIESEIASIKSGRSKPVLPPKKPTD